MVECHIGWTVMAKTQDTTVCTLMAIGITMTAITAIAFSRSRCCFGVPVQPRARGL